MEKSSPYIQTDTFVKNTYTELTKVQLKKILKCISKEFPANKNHHFFTLIDDNFFIESIRKQVDAKQVDMIVMGTKGATGLKKLIIGSNAADVIKKVKCATLIVPEEAMFTDLNEIAFPTDYFLNYGVNLLKPIYNIIEDHHSSLRVVHITSEKEGLGIGQLNNKELLKDFFNSFKVSFHNLNNIKVEDALECFIQSRDIKMVVMVAKNLNYFQQILFHSKIERISYHITIPFLVIHG
jgi:hypothetical protein